MYKNFKERGGTDMKGSRSWSVDALYCGPVLGARGKVFVVFWDWETGEVVRRINVEAKNVRTGSLIAIASEDSFYVLHFNQDAYTAKLDEGAETMDEGVKEVQLMLVDSVKTAKWVRDCFIYTASNQNNYFVGNESYTISLSDTPMYILSYAPAHNCIYLTNKAMSIYTCSLSLNIVKYQTAVLHGDMDAAGEILPSIPREQLNKVARFLEARDLKELAMQITTDPNHKFDLALALDDLDAALGVIMQSVPETEAESKWKALGDHALAVWRFNLAKGAYEKAGDLGLLMLLIVSMGDRIGLEWIAAAAGASFHAVLLRTH
ncbi:hypothetical protein SCLCIDRAFT_32837 [Scleroderma citrinum Foug A]|uniref:Uncharacterized protein n=1 Tax=Scleroderma citrinum Foug A TaxID=1036808 RepID=A0A0C2YR28_9AGAM|nr:hypothetical protein SCLCIDRAFT_32837 [Scleroderma citrinum Foug A]